MNLSNIIFNMLINIAIKNNEKKPEITNLSPINKSHIFNIIIFTKGYAIPKVIIVSGKVKNTKKGLIV